MRRRLPRRSAASSAASSAATSAATSATKSGAKSTVSAGGWQLDWITPAASDAPLAAAALPEAAERLQRRAWPAPSASAALVQQRARVPVRPGLSLQVGAGPAWHGYFGLQLSLLPPPRQAWPAGTTAWLALVELLPAGSEGNAQARALVRSVAGPLLLDGAAPGRRLTHLRALRWPDSATAAAPAGPRLAGSARRPGAGHGRQPLPLSPMRPA